MMLTKMKVKKVYENSQIIEIGGYKISNLSNIIEIYDDTSVHDVSITFDKDDLPELIKFLTNVLLEDDAKKYNI